jgi:hypothetical protein
MPGFTSYDDIVNEVTVNGKVKEHAFYKAGAGPEAAGVMQTFWKSAGLPGAGSNPAASPGTAYANEVGSLFLQNEASDTKFLLRWEAVATQNCTLVLFDRLVGVGGLNLATTGDKVVASAALPRYADGLGVEAWLEVTTASTTAPTVSMNSYTDTDNNAAQAGGSVAFPAAATNVDTIVPLTLAARDYGLKACSTINVSAAGTACVCNFLLVRRLAMLPLVANVGAVIDYTLGFPPLKRIYDGASLGLAIVASGTSALTIQGALTFGWG